MTTVVSTSLLPLWRSGSALRADKRLPHHDHLMQLQRNFRGPSIEAGERMDTWTAFLKPATEQSSEVERLHRGQIGAP
jgi:hypothetical protein